MTAIKRVLFVHQGAELYGSDRTFVQSIRACRERFPRWRITVFLPERGPLVNALKPLVDDIVFVDMIVLRKSTVKSLLLHPGKLIVRVRAACRAIKSYDVVYVNTIVVIDFILASRFSRTPVIIHMHELPTGFLAKIFSGLLWWAKGRLIFNSRATRESIALLGSKQFAVVENGVAGGEDKQRKCADCVNLLMIGRLNSWKGQDLLLDALGQLPHAQLDKVKVRFVGGVYKDQHAFRDAVIAQCDRYGLRAIVEFYEFAPVPAEHYRWADVVVVPSRRPEPFGLVVIEAMSFGCAVIAARNGGMKDIVTHDASGLFFEPDDVEELVACIQKYLDMPALARSHGNIGRAEFLKRYDERIYIRKIQDFLANVAGA